MRNRSTVPVSLLIVLVTLSACGSGQDRPVIVATYPAQDEVIPGTIQEVRITYDDPVTILNPIQVAVTSGDDAIPLVPRVDPNDPHTILLTPDTGSFWRAGTTTVILAQGFEVNEHEQYRLDSYTLRFTLGAALPVYFGVPAPASVVEAEGLSFTPVNTVPTPGTRAPVGLACSLVGVAQRIWVQLEDGGGSGEALAWFAPRAVAMTTVALTHDGAGDLVATSAALRVSPDGRFVYAAYRDTALERVRLHRIDVVAALETDTLLLSPTASAGTSPQGLAVTPDDRFVDVACATTSGARLVRVDTATFTEVDLGPDAGVDGQPLPVGAGPTVSTNASTFVAPRPAASAELTQVRPAQNTLVSYASTVIGSPSTALLTIDQSWVLEGVTGYADEEAFSYRSTSSLLDELMIVIDDDTGQGNGPATSVLDVAWFPGFTRLVALLDNDAAIILRFLSNGIAQEDLDETTPWAAIDLSTVAPGATRVAFPPPSVPPPR